MSEQSQTGGPPAEHNNRPVEGEGPKAVATYNPPGSNLDRAGAGGFAVSTRNETASAMLAAREAKAIEVRALMAERHPRNVDTFRAGILAACKRVGFADMAMYEKPVGGGKNATGLSIRFAEEAIRHWKNAEVSVSVIAEDDDSRTLEAVASDYETNILYRTQARVPKYVERLNTRAGDEVIGQRVNSRGVMTYRIRASDDALFTAERAAAAKASREVTLKLMPSDILEECESEIEKTLAAIGGDPAKFLERLLDKFNKLGVVREQLERLTGKDLGVLNIAELRRLDRIHNAIKMGETDWETVVAESAERKKGTPAAAGAEGQAGAEPTKSGGDKLKAAAKSQAPAASTPAAPAAETKPEPKAAETKAEPKAAPAKLPDSRTDDGPAIAAKDCPDCGAKKGKPHQTECPLA